MPTTRTLGRFGLGILVLLVATSAFAQYAGSIRGTVADTTGAVVPGATVTFTNEATRFARNVVTDARGEYYFGAIQPGVYTLVVEIPGFKTSERKGLRISPNENAGFDVRLEVGAQTERVEVTAVREMIQTQTGAREGLITAEQIENLSMIGRSPIELLRILPGAVTPDITALESVGNLTGSAGTSAYNVNGIRGSNNTVSLDGSKLIDIGSNNGVIVVPNNDFVSEVKVQSSNYAAEYGSAGVQINAITKGGGSEFHGTLYDYVRHHSYQSNDKSNEIAGIDKPKSSFQYPGGNLSGPILIPGTGFNKNRDKAFFFVGVEVQRQNVDRGSSFAVTPTAGQRVGNFADTVGGQNLNQPTVVNIPGGFPGAGSPAPGNNLAPYIDPFGKALIDLYPMPNFVDPNNRYNYVFNTLEPQNRLQIVGRVDYSFSENTKAYVRYAQDGEELDKARGAWWDSSAYALPSSLTHKNKGRSISANMTSVLSPTTTNEVLFTFSKLFLDIYRTNPERTQLSTLGFPNFAGPWGQQVDVAPVQIYSWGQGLGDLWDPVGQDIYAYNSSMMLSDTFTKVLNTHAIKAGFAVERVRKDQNFQNNEQMAITLGSGWIPGTTGTDFGDLLVGRPAQVDAGTRAKDGNFQLWNIDFFVQDSWKVRKNVTLEYGVRFSKMTNNIERQGLGSVFIPSTYNPALGSFTDNTLRYLNGQQYVELGQVDKNLVDSRPIYVMPRVNFAWDIKGDGDLIVRGGGGLFYNRPMGNAEYDVVRFPPNAYNISLGAYDAVPAGGGEFMNYNNLSLYDPFARVGTQGITGTMNPDSIFYPRIFSTSLSVGKRLPWQQFLEVGYVGTFGRHLLNSRHTNVIPEGALLSGTLGNADLSVPVNRVALDSTAYNELKPYPSLGQVTWWEYGGTSNYHSLQATLSRQTSGRLQYFVAYTFSKALGLWSDEYAEVDPFNARGRSYGILPYDRTHILNVSWNYQAPDAIKGDGNAVLKGFLNGWQLSGISSFSSGTPIRFNFSGELGGDGMQRAWFGSPDVGGEVPGAGAIPPIYTCDPGKGGSAEVGDKYFNLSCIGIPTFNEVGPFVSPYYVRSPSRWNHDLTLFKNFKMGGSKMLQFRAGLFNIFDQSYATANTQDMDLLLQTECNVRVNGVPNGVGGTNDNVCDPTGGFRYTDNTLANFGKVILQRGRRIVEFAVKFYF